MANRRTHTKLRAEIRARMAATGESHQQARLHILSRADDRASRRTTNAVDLVPLAIFGVPMTLATIQGTAVSSFALLPHTPRSAGSQSVWLPSMRFHRPQGVN